MTVYPFAEPLYVMAKPAGASCNLRCRYCYYLEKEILYSSKRTHTMSDEVLERYIKDYIDSQTTAEILFCWHGGEPLLQPISFYKKALRLQKQYAPQRRISNSIQTNGTLITDEWAMFLKQNNFLVGVSIDGPQHLHDHYRTNSTGRGTWELVMKGINCLNEHHVEWNAMAVVNNITTRNPLEFYQFFKSIKCRYIQFTPVVERIINHADGRSLATPQDGDSAQLAPFSVNPKEWGQFLCTIFDEWVRHDVGEYFIQLFDSTLANWVGQPPSLCTMAKTCGHAGVMEHNGDVYSCDHFVFPEYKLGNIMSASIISMMKSQRQLNFGRAKQGTLPKQCQMCEWLFTCNGECPKNRFLKTPEGDIGLNYLCQGYQAFFSHVAPAMDIMKRLLLNNMPPAMIMKQI